jgi:hypothetical protein
VLLSSLIPALLLSPLSSSSLLLLLLLLCHTLISSSSRTFLPVIAYEIPLLLPVSSLSSSFLSHPPPSFLITT